MKGKPGKKKEKKRKRHEKRLSDDRDFVRREERGERIAVKLKNLTGKR